MLQAWKSITKEEQQFLVSGSLARYSFFPTKRYITEYVRDDIQWAGYYCKVNLNWMIQGPNRKQRGLETPWRSSSSNDDRLTVYRMIFINFSSAFSTILPGKCMTKLLDLYLNTSLSNWVLDFLTKHKRFVRFAQSSTLTFSTSATLGCELSPLLYTHDLHTQLLPFIKFAKNTTVPRLISNDESAYRGEIQNLAVNLMSWPQPESEDQENQRCDCGLSEIRSAQPASALHQWWQYFLVEWVTNVNFLGLTVTKELSWQLEWPTVSYYKQ